mgnify:CR=1 FL=1
MDVRIDKQNEGLLRKLAQLNGQPTAAGMVRLWIHNAAKEAGLIPLSSETVDVGSQPAVSNQSDN